MPQRLFGAVARWLDDRCIDEGGVYRYELSLTAPGCQRNALYMATVAGIVSVQGVQIAKTPRERTSGRPGPACRL